MYFAHNYHVVRTAEGVVVVPRTQHVDLKSSYADTRGWDVAKWSESPELAQAIVNDGRGELIAAGVAQGMVDGVREKLGLNPSTNANGGGSTASGMPEIVIKTIEPGTGANTAPSADSGSLFDRLSRQFGSTPTSNPASMSSQPATNRVEQRSVPRNDSPTWSPYSPTSVSPPSNLNDRAARPTSLETTALPQPQINLSQMQSFSPLIEQPAESNDRAIPVPPLSERLADTIAAIKTSLPEKAPVLQPATVESAVTSPPAALPTTIDPRSQISAAGPTRPVQIDGNHLRQAIPQQLRQEFGWDPNAASAQDQISGIIKAY